MHGTELLRRLTFFVRFRTSAVSGGLSWGFSSEADGVDAGGKSRILGERSFWYNLRDCDFGCRYSEVHFAISLALVCLGSLYQSY